MAARRSATDRKTPRLRRRLVRTAKKPSTALSQEAEVGVNAERGRELGYEMSFVGSGAVRPERGLAGRYRNGAFQREGRSDLG